MLVLLILYAVLFLILMGTVYLEPLKRYHTLAKTANSLGYVAVAIYGYVQSGDSNLFFSMLPAFVLCLLGDFFLSLPSADDYGVGFIAGLVSFALGHVMFLVAFIKMTPIVWPELIFPALMVIIVYIITRGPGFEMGSMTIPVLIYALLASWTFSRTVVIMLEFGLTGRTLCLLAGAFLFMFSDIVILFIYFYNKEYKWSSFLNLFTYYLGLFLLAASIYFIV